MQVMYMDFWGSNSIFLRWLYLVQLYYLHPQADVFQDSKMTTLVWGLSLHIIHSIEHQKWSFMFIKHQCWSSFCLSPISAEANCESPSTKAWKWLRAWPPPAWNSFSWSPPYSKEAALMTRFLRREAHLGDADRINHPEMTRMTPLGRGCEGCRKWTHNVCHYRRP